MTQHNSRLLNEPRLRRMVELTDELSEHGQSVADALADYESAGELDGDERADAREDARETFMQAIGDLKATYAQLAAEVEKVTSAVAG